VEVDMELVAFLLTQAVISSAQEEFRTGDRQAERHRIRGSDKR
jgi:hypothetical protein